MTLSPHAYPGFLRFIEILSDLISKLEEKYALFSCQTTKPIVKLARTSFSRIKLGILIGSDPKYNLLTVDWEKVWRGWGLGDKNILNTENIDFYV